MAHKDVPDEIMQKWQERVAEMQLESYSTMYALHTVAQHWVETDNAIEQAAIAEVEQNGPKWEPDVNDQDSLGEFFALRDAERVMHDQILIPMHRYSCIVMLFTAVERELLRLVENLEKERGPQKLKWKDVRANSKVEQISKWCEAFFGFRLVDCSQYAALIDLQKIRDCIIHCQGEVELSRDKVDLEKLSRKRRGLHIIATGELYIDTDCIKVFLAEMWVFFVSVFNSLNWTIPAHWQGDKLGELFKKLKAK